MVHFFMSVLPQQTGAGMACRNSSPRAGHQQETLLICQSQTGFCAVTAQMFTQQKFDLFFPLLNSSILLIYIYFFFTSKFLLHVYSVASTRNTQLCPWDRVREGTEPSCATGDQTEVGEFLTAPGLIRLQNTSSFFTCISTYSLQKKLQGGLFCKNQQHVIFFSAVEMSWTEALASNRSVPA